MRALAVVVVGALGALASRAAAAAPGPPEPIAGIAVAPHGSCAWSTAGHVYCWGSGLVQDTSIQMDAAQPRRVPELADVTQVGIGEAHACALLRDHTVRCWGWNDNGMLGDGTAERRAGLVRVPLDHVTELAVGPGHACARRTDGTVWCWGERTGEGSLGVAGSNRPRRPVRVPGVANAVEVVAGAFHVCARLADGSVTCWGMNHQGQAHGAADEKLAPRQVPAIREAIALAAGGFRTCARLRDQSVRCWGEDAEHDPPAQDLGAVAAVATGGANTCVLHADGTVQCWGAVAWITDGARGLRGVTQLAVAARHACAVAAGDVTCWGDDRGNELGDGVATPVFRSGRVPGVSGVVAVETRSITPCALHGDGNVECWGGATSRTLPDQTSAPGDPATRAVAGGGTSLAVGEAVGCIVTRAHTVQCWGGPPELPAWTDVAQVGVGREDYCVRHGDGTVECVGPLAAGARQLARVRDLAVGYGFACVTRRDDTVSCWGNYSDPWPTTATPPQVLGLRDVVHVSVGATDACAVLRDGSVRCWAMSADAADRAQPFHAVAVANVGDAIDVASGIGLACALRRDGTVRCWGTSEADVMAPGFPDPGAVVDPGVTGATQITAGSRHACARLADGGVQCWGNNGFGELGLPMQLGLPPQVARRVAWPSP